MSSREQSVTLLRQNKRKMVDNLTAIGFTDLSYDMRASEFPKYIKWAGGLLDLNVAANRVLDDGSIEHRYFTADEWKALTDENKSLYFRRGVRVRARHQSFIIPINPQIADMKYCDENVGIPGVPYYSSTDAPGSDLAGLLNEYNSRTYTEAIASITSNTPAADAVLAFREDEPADDSKWGLPCLVHLILIYRYFHEINNFISQVWNEGYIIGQRTYWSCLPTGSWGGTAAAWYFNMSSGDIYYQNKNVVASVLPICVEPSKL